MFFLSPSRETAFPVSIFRSPPRGPRGTPAYGPSRVSRCGAFPHSRPCLPADGPLLLPTDSLPFPASAISPPGPAPDLSTPLSGPARPFLAGRRPLASQLASLGRLQAGQACSGTRGGGGRRRRPEGGALPCLGVLTQPAASLTTAAHARRQTKGRHRAPWNAGASGPDYNSQEAPREAQPRALAAPASPSTVGNVVRRCDLHGGSRRALLGAQVTPVWTESEAQTCSRS